MTHKITSTISSARQVSRAKSLTRKLFAAVVLSATLVMSGPASAAALNFSFNFGQGAAFSNFFSIGHHHTYGSFFGHTHSDRRVCMNNSSIKAWLRDQGFRSVRYISAGYRTMPKFSALWQGVRYSMSVDRCTGAITNVQQVYPVGHDRHSHDTPVYPYGLHDHSAHSHGSFNFSFHSH